MGCPEHIFALHKAYLYAIKHYNLSKRVLVAGASMGGHTAMNFAHTFPGIVTALGLIYPRLNMDGVEIDGHYCIGTWDKTKKSEKTGYSTHDRIVQIYRFPEDEWFAPNTVGFNPYLTRSYIGADGKRVVIPPCLSRNTNCSKIRCWRAIPWGIRPPCPPSFSGVRNTIRPKNTC